jgi:exodeoxyribonuclease VIII
MIITAPGIYKGLTIDEYHKSEGISSSGISLLIPPNCPKMYWHQYLSGNYVKNESDSMIIGSAVHTLALEPHRFDELFYVMSNCDRRTMAGKEKYTASLLEAGSRALLNDAQFVQAKAMAESITSHRLFKNLRGDGFVEDSIAWTEEESGALLRSRPDFYNETIILDIKTTRDVRRHSFSKAIYDYGYHRQGAMACDGLSNATGRKYENVVLFLVSDDPYLTKAYVLSTEAIEMGRFQYKEGAKLYQECLKSNNWPGYDESIEEIDLPSWAYHEFY